MSLTVERCVCVCVCEEQTSVKWQWRTFPPVKNVRRDIKHTFTATNTHLHTELLLPTDSTNLLFPIRVGILGLFFAWMALQLFILLPPSAPFQYSVRTCRPCRGSAAKMRGRTHREDENEERFSGPQGFWSQYWLQTPLSLMGPFTADMLTCRSRKSISYIDDGSDLISVYSSEPARTIPGPPLSGLQPALMLWNTHALLLLWQVKKSAVGKKKSIVLCRGLFYCLSG